MKILVTGGAGSFENKFVELPLEEPASRSIHTREEHM